MVNGELTSRKQGVDEGWRRLSTTSTPVTEDAGESIWTTWAREGWYKEIRAPWWPQTGNSSGWGSLMACENELDWGCVCCCGWHLTRAPGHRSTLAVGLGCSIGAQVKELKTQMGATLRLVVRLKCETLQAWVETESDAGMEPRSGRKHQGAGPWPSHRPQGPP